MREIIYPYFNSGRVLKQEMLESMRDFPRDALDVYNETMSNGIVSGLTPKVDKDIITFSKGVVKYKGELYVFNSPTLINYADTEVDILIKLNFYDEIKDKDYRTQYVEIEIDRNTGLLDNQIELGRFKLKKGAYLRSDYQDLFDFTTEYNTINIVHVLYAGYLEPTISGKILKYFAKEALEARAQEQMDITFCMMCLNSSRIERQVIYNYIAYKQKEAIKDMANQMIHDKLALILKQIKRENMGEKRKGAAAARIIVD